MTRREIATVHAEHPEVDYQVVRYDRAGKWRLHHEGHRYPIDLRRAVLFATAPGAIWHEGRPGGRTFDARVRATHARLKAKENQ